MTTRFSFDKKSVNEKIFTINGVFFDIFCCILRKFDLILRRLGVILRRQALSLNVMSVFVL